MCYRPNFGNRKGVRKTDEAMAWERDTQWLCKAAHWQPIDGDVAMTVELFYKTERDIDSSQKILQDCLQSYAYHDDRQIKRLLITKCKDSANPRVVVSVEHLPLLGDGAK